MPCTRWLARAAHLLKEGLQLGAVDQSDVAPLRKVLCLVGEAARGDHNPAGGAFGRDEHASQTSSSDPAKADHFPRAIKDQAKRDEIRARLLAVLAEAEANAKAQAEKGSAAAAPPAGQMARGQREATDVEEFGRFVAQAIREDFVPMARGCAKDLASRRPDAGGIALMAVEVLGDAKIGGVANSAEIVELKQDRIVVDEQRRTSLPGVWAGGDCVYGGEDLTVSAVQDGKLAALSIDKALAIDKFSRSA